MEERKNRWKGSGRGERGSAELERHNKSKEEAKEKLERKEEQMKCPRKSKREVEEETLEWN